MENIHLSSGDQHASGDRLCRLCLSCRPYKLGASKEGNPVRKISAHSGRLILPLPLFCRLASST